MFDFKKHTVVVMYKAATYYLLLKKWVSGFGKENVNRQVSYSPMALGRARLRG